MLLWPILFTLTFPCLSSTTFVPKLKPHGLSFLITSGPSHCLSTLGLPILHFLNSWLVAPSSNASQSVPYLLPSLVSALYDSQYLACLLNLSPCFGHEAFCFLNFPLLCITTYSTSQPHCLCCFSKDTSHIQISVSYLYVFLDNPAPHIHYESVHNLQNVREIAIPYWIQKQTQSLSQCFFLKALGYFTLNRVTYLLVPKSTLSP